MTQRSRKKAKSRPSGGRSGAEARFSGSYLAQSFLEYYAQRGHTVVPSAPLVPDDPTLLFTAAGMVQFKSYYSDPAAAPYPTAASVQKCLRAGGKQSDLENVGRTVRHHTFFEMLGNFSFGDYFKKEAIETAWELSVDVWGIDRDRLWISVYEDDDEAHDLWAKRIGVPAKRIVRLGKKDNFWGPVGDTGVCGPSSELYFDTGKDRSCGKRDCRPGCDCDRYIEYWNLVFPQFFYTEEGDYDRLPKPGIDTGMGLERLAFILQEVEDNFHTDLFLPIRNAIEGALPERSRADAAALAVNAAADHVRALVFALSEGVMPSNEGRGYVLRRLLRRALTKMHPFGVKEPFLAPAVDAVVETMGGRYPELRQRVGLVRKVITAEEEHFLSTIEQGWSKFEEVIDRGRRSKDRTIDGRDAFLLYDTYGFPFEMTTELALDAGLRVDEAAFHREMEAQKQRSRGRGAARTGTDDREIVSRLELKSAGETKFLGYDELSCDAEVTTVEVLREDGPRVVEATTDRTVFYPEGGGQVGDTGTAEVGGNRLDVVDAYRRDNHIVHRIRWEGPGDDVEPVFRSSPRVHLEVNRETRLSTARNHTATHLLHKALRETLGDHVTQAGSLVAPDRLRFDFHHFQPMTDEEVHRVEAMVNEAVLEDRAVSADIVPYREAIEQGAMALFGEKYSDRVRMVTIDGLSKELCGGTHLDRTGEVGIFIITYETAVAAGVRRMEALTGRGALQYVRGLLRERAEMAELLRVAPDDLVRRVATLRTDYESLKRSLGEEQNRHSARRVGEALNSAEDIKGVKLVTFQTGAGDLASLRKNGDQLREKMDLGVALLCLADAKKPVTLVVVSDRLLKDKGLKANELATSIAGELSLKGGGKPHMAQLGMREAGDFAKITSFVRAWLKDHT